jgi:general secretion pathway protein M
MQLVPDERSSRLTAVLLLAIAAILVYLLGFHWFVGEHLTYAEEVSGLREQLARFEATADQREPLQAQLATIRQNRRDADLFLEQGDFNEAAAAMSERLGQMVTAQADPNCQIVSRQPVRPRVQERYNRVTVNVRMRCRVEYLLDILYRLESEVPLMMIDDLNIIRPRARRRVGGRVVDVTEELDIRFNMLGYLR